MPTWAALAPAHSTAASAAPSAIPPVAISGSGVPLREDAKQREQPDPALVGAVVDEPPAMAAGLGSLGDERIRAGRARHERLRQVRDRNPHGDPDSVQTVYHRCLRAAERERHCRRPLLVHHLELGLPVVVVEPGLAELGSLALGLGAESIEVVAECGRVGGLRCRHEHVDPERRGCPDRTRSGSGLSPRRRRLYPAARKPSPPASHTAIASSGVDGPPAIGAWTIGSGSVLRSNVVSSLRSVDTGPPAAASVGPCAPSGRGRTAPRTPSEAGPLCDQLTASAWAEPKAIGSEAVADCHTASSPSG